METIYHDIKLTGEEPTKLVITNTNSDDKEYKINISDFINQKINKYRAEGEYELLEIINGAVYSEHISSQLIETHAKKGYENEGYLTLNILKEDNESNENFAQKLIKSITTESKLGVNHNVNYHLYNCNESALFLSPTTRKILVDKEKNNDNEDKWHKMVDAYCEKTIGSCSADIYKKNDTTREYDIHNDYQVMGGYIKVTPFNRPRYIDCIVEGPINSQLRLPSMAIKSGQIMPDIKVELHNDNGLVPISGKVTASISTYSDEELICIKGTNHCQEATLSSFNDNTKCNKESEH